MNHGGGKTETINMKEVVKIVHYKEVEDFLESIIKLEKIGEATCSICGAKITPENFKALVRKSGKILFCCDKPECYRLFIETLRK